MTSRGYKYWLNELNNNGDTRAHQILAFGVSGEFGGNVAALCAGPATGGGLRYVLSDAQGSTRAVMSNNGSSSAIVARHDYLPFGEEIGSGIGLRSTTQAYAASDTNRQRYGLTERDNTTGLDHTWWRKYESFAGRWTSPDPYNGSMAVANPQSLNHYSYVQNDPVNAIDPSGLLMCFGYHVFILHFEDGKLTGVDYLGFLPVFCWDDGPVGGRDPSGGGPRGGQRFNHPQKPPPDKLTVIRMFLRICIAFGKREGTVLNQLKEPNGLPRTTGNTDLFPGPGPVKLPRRAGKVLDLQEPSRRLTRIRKSPAKLVGLVRSPRQREATLAGEIKERPTRSDYRCMSLLETRSGKQSRIPRIQSRWQAKTGGNLLIRRK